MGETAADRTHRDVVRVIASFGMRPRVSDLARLRDAIRNASTAAVNPVRDGR